jgi:uncharacterized protein
MGAPDLAGLRAYVVGRLERELPAALKYHCVAHTIDDVVPAAMRLASLRGLSARDAALLEAGALLHDVGFVERRDGHEQVGVRVAREVLPEVGFDAAEIDVVAGIIGATRLPQSPRTPLEMLMADADLDVLGRGDFFDKNDALRAELAAYGQASDDARWYREQLNFVVRHSYFTDVAGALRRQGKERNIAEMRRRLRDSPAGAGG